MLKNVFSKSEKNNLVEITDFNFNDIVFRSELPVIIYFWASWCNTCYVTNSLIQRLVKDYEKKVLIGAVNIDQNTKLTRHFKIKRVPALLFIEGQTIHKHISGLINYDEIIQHTKKLIKINRKSRIR